MPDLDGQLLQRIGIFGALSKEGIALLTRSLKTFSYCADDTVYREGDQASSMFILATGRVAILKYWNGKQYVLGHCQSGDCIGEMALMDMHPRSASVVCVEATTLFELDNEALLELYRTDLEQFTLLQMNLGREVSRRLREADERMFLWRLNAAASEGLPELTSTVGDRL